MKVIFQANDGKQFDTACACEKYEEVSLIQLSDVVAGAKFAYDTRHPVTIIVTWPDKYHLGGFQNNSYRCFSSAMNFTKQEMLEYLRNNKYVKVS